jgi:hypothetical protein
MARHGGALGNKEIQQRKNKTIKQVFRFFAKQWIKLFAFFDI